MSLSNYKNVEFADSEMDEIAEYLANIDDNNYFKTHKILKHGIVVSTHALNRAVKRSGVNKRSIERLAVSAYEKGLKHKETKGLLFKYISSIYKKNMNPRLDIRVYGGFVYLFFNNPNENIIKFVTMYHIPSSLNKQEKHMNDKKKKKNKQYEIE